MVKVILGVVDALAWGLRALGVDYAQFRALLEVKLTLDGRRQFTAFQQQGGRTSRNAFALALLVNASMGVVLALGVSALGSALLALTLVHAFVMVFVTLSLIGDFSSVLLDTADAQILQPRPISNPTVLAARIAHVVTYILLLTLSLSAATFVTGTRKYGTGFPAIFALSLVASVCLVVGVVNILYMLALRVTSGERVRDLITYVQIVTTVLIIGAWQVLPRLLNVEQLGTWNLTAHWWVYLVPPVWLAAPVELLLGTVDPPRLILTALGVVVPVASIAAALALAPGFREALARLETAPAPAARAHRQAPTRGGGLAAWIAHRPVERAAFEFLWALSGRDRQFKLRTYPNIAFVLILSVVFVFNDPEGFGHALATLPDSQKHLLMLYLCCALAPAGLLYLRYSDRYEAAWIYRVLPLHCPGEVLRAGLKVILLRLVVPQFLLVATAVLLIWGPRVVPDLLLAAAAVLLASTAYGLLIGARFPFSEPFGVMESSGRFARAMLHLLFAAAFGGLHYLLTAVPYAVPLATVAVALAAAAALHGYGRTSWRTVLAEEGPRGTSLS